MMICGQIRVTQDAIKGVSAAEEAKWSGDAQGGCTEHSNT